MNQTDQTDQTQHLQHAVETFRHSYETVQRKTHGTILDGTLQVLDEEQCTWVAKVMIAAKGQPDNIIAVFVNKQNHVIVEEAKIYKLEGWCRVNQLNPPKVRCAHVNGIGAIHITEYIGGVNGIKIEGDLLHGKVIACSCTDWDSVPRFDPNTTFTIECRRCGFNHTYKRRPADIVNSPAYPRWIQCLIERFEFRSQEDLAEKETSIHD